MIGGADNQMTKASFSNGQLRSIVERIERLEDEKKALSVDIKDMYTEAKGNGFDTKTLRKLIALRKLDRHEREEAQAMLEVYMDALGMLAETPLGQAAIEREVKTAPALDKAIRKLGTPVPLTEEEKAKGAIAAFDKDGTRMSIVFPEGPAT